MKNPIFTGCATAVVTPFTAEGIDYPALRRLLERQLDAGTDALVVCGTTGEASTMTYSERMEVIRFAVRQIGGRIPLIAGTGSNNTAAAVRLSRDAAVAGADGLLVVTPYYNKASQQGLIRHYRKIADSVDRPLILYNVPTRTGVSCTAETYAALASHPNISGVKEASGNYTLVQDTLRLCPADFSVWSGNDEDTASICTLGGRGVISTAANVIPAEMHRLTHAALSGRTAEASRLQLELKPLIDALFMEVNPIPVKTALHLLGLCEERFRLPLCPLSAQQREKLGTVLREFHLLKT